VATLSKRDLLQRNNVQTFTDRVNNQGSFRLKTNDGPLLQSTGFYRLKDNIKVNELSPTFLSKWLEEENKDKLYIEVKKETQITFENITSLYKDKEFGGTPPKAGGMGTERQETGLINIINELALANDKMVIKTLGNLKIKSAEKNEGLSSIGKEPYIDIMIHTRDKKTLGISAKGTQAPSLAGGGIGGLKVVVPDLLPKLYATITNHMQKTMKLKQKEKVTFATVPDIFVEIPDKYVRPILEGIPKMGGPITHMYIGPMEVTGELRNDTLTLNGSFFSIEEYMRKIPKFFFKMRKRDIRFERSGFMSIEYNEKTGDGFPKLFKGATNGKNLSRLVIVDEPTIIAKSKGAVLKI